MAGIIDPKDLQILKDIQGEIVKLKNEVISLGKSVISTQQSFSGQAKSQKQVVDSSKQLSTLDKELIKLDKQLERAEAQLTDEYKKVQKVVLAKKEAVRKSNEELKKQAGIVRKSSGYFKNMAKTLLATGAAFFGINKLLTGFNRLITNSIQGADKQIRAETQVTQAIKSTGKAAGFTTEELKKQASELQKLTRFKDEDILKDVTSNLLTFTNIVGSEFTDAQEIILDMSELLGQDLKSSSIQVGKALNDPIKGITALTRVGVSFTDEQKKVIKQLQKTGNTAGAQKVILEELNKEFGGQAKAAATVGTGAYTRLKNVLGDISENLGKRLLPFINRVSKNLIERLTPQEKSVNLYRLENKELNTLFNVLKSGNLSNKTRNKLIKEINDKYGEYLPNLLTEKSTLEDIQKAQDAVNKAMRLKIIQSSFQEEITKLLQDELNAQEGLVQSEIDREKLAQDRLFVQSEGEKLALEQNERALDLLDGINKSIIKNNDKEIQSTKDKFKRIGEIYGIAYDEIENIVNKSTEEIENSNNKFTDLQLKNIKTLTDRVNAQYDKRAEKFTSWLEKSNELFTDDIAEQIEAEENVTQKIEEEQKKRLKIYQDEGKSRKELDELYAQNRQALEDGLITIITTSFDNFIDANLSKFEADQEAKKDIQKNRLDKGQITEEQYQKRIAEIERQSRIKSAQAEKKKQLFQIGIDTASAIIKQASVTSLPLGLPFILAVGTLGLTQAATVAATPIPKFKKGTGKGGVKGDTLAKVSEAGIELGITKEGQMFLTPEKESYMYLQKGTEIFPHESKETQEVLKSSNYEKMMLDKMDENTKQLKRIAFISHKNGMTTVDRNNTRTTYLRRYGLDN